MHFRTFNFKRQLNFTNIFNVTVDFATVWPATSEFMVECLRLLFLCNARLSFDFLPPVWCELELQITLAEMYCGNGGSIFGKPVQTVWVWFTHSSTETRNLQFMKNITCWWIITKITKLVLYFIDNIGYIQRGKERTSCKCIFFLLELREISLELNFKGLKVVWYRRLQITRKFFGFLTL